ncbi:MAG TPA: SMI1/KNR4 family protein [Pirellulales bacterium]|nr:SMI1/KNR4 family protein [Pirellulales bacterium]
MIALWRRLENHLQQTFPAALRSLNPPATEEQLARAERMLGFALPEDIKQLLLVHDGQLQETGRPPHTVPLIPSTEAATWGEFAPLDLIVHSSNSYNATDWSEQLEHYEFDGPVCRDPALRMLVFVDAGSGDVLAMDLNPPPEGEYAQVVAINHDPPQLIVRSPSLRDWFEELVARYESGRYVIGDIDGVPAAIDRNEQN